MFHTLPFRREAAGPVESVDGTVEGLVSLTQVGGLPASLSSAVERRDVFLDDKGEIRVFGSQQKLSRASERGLVQDHLPQPVRGHPSHVRAWHQAGLLCGVAVDGDGQRREFVLVEMDVEVRQKCRDSGPGGSPASM